MRRVILASLLPVMLLACAPKAEVDELSARVEALEQRVKELESKPAAKAAGAAAAAPAAAASAEDEQAAMDLYNAANEAMEKGDIDDAKVKIDALLKDYGRTRIASRAVRVKRELDVVGKDVKTPQVEKWFQGSASDLNLEDGTTLVVFWEVWCPHCRREVPELQKLAEKYQGRMDVVGLTKITKSATEEKVTEFIKEQKVTYAIAKETGDASQEFAVSGIPAAAVVKDGKVVWRGHPGRLNEEMIDGWI
ncbi:MAG: TlpA family protein disulfide reductase [Alphaproteobacteria bacterium]|nr:TlpA family protein disulfide reductase [Alphaproteobacteria bacterium]